MKEQNQHTPAITGAVGLLAPLAPFATFIIPFALWSLKKLYRHAVLIVMLAVGLNYILPAFQSLPECQGIVPQIHAYAQGDRTNTAFAAAVPKCLGACGLVTAAKLASWTITAFSWLRSGLVPFILKLLV